MNRCALLVLSGCLVAGGCRLGQGATTTLAKEEPPAVELCQAEQEIAPTGEVVKVDYVTEADRLNVASGGGAFPAASRCLLRVESPHPAGKPGLARVTLAVEPKQQKVGWWARRFGKEAPTPTPSVVRVLDISAAEVQSLLETLDEQRFYVRSKPLTTDAFVGVERKGERFAKEFRSLPQLDALVMRTHQQGGGVGPRTSTVEFAAGGAAGYPTTTATIAGGVVSQCRLLPPVSAETLR